MAFSREQPSPRYQALLAQYQQLHREGERARGIPPEEKYKGISLPRHAGTIKELIDQHGAKTVLDYGAGKGRQYQDYRVKTAEGDEYPSIPAFWRVDSVTCYDPAVPSFSQLPAGPFDGVISTDVLEHVPEEDVDWIIGEMLSFARCFLFLNIASFQAKAHLPNGENAHCTIKSTTWWRNVLTRLQSARPSVQVAAIVVEMQPGARPEIHQIDLLAQEIARIESAKEHAPDELQAALAANELSTAARLAQARLDQDATNVAALEALAQVAEALGQTDNGTILRRLAAESRHAIHLNVDADTACQLEQAFPASAAQQAAALTRQGDQQLAQGQFDTAADRLAEAAQLAPESIDARCNHATGLLQAGRVNEADAALRDCLAIDDHHARSKYNLASCLLEQGDLEAAYAILGDLIDEHDATDNHVRDARWVRSLILLQMENFSRGWPEYEQRWESTRGGPKPRLDLPEYQGESLAGRGLMIYPEQGLGDEIMFASCLSPMIEAAERTTLVCSQRLESLFRRSFPQAHVTGLPQQAKIKPAAGVGQFDYQLAIGSVPRFTRASRTDFAAAAPFLTADAQLVDSFRQQLAALPGGVKIGIAWRGGRDAQDVRLRSMPLATWGPILRSVDADFIDLQYDSTAEEREQLFQRYGARLHCFEQVDPTGPLDATAALTAALDLVISVDNTLVHLAGGLGVPTWTMLPVAWGWRWHRQRDTSLFYPTMSLMRQQQHGDWATVAAIVSKRLRSWVGTQEAASEVTVAETPLPTHEGSDDTPAKLSGPNYLKLPKTAPHKKSSEFNR